MFCIYLLSLVSFIDLPPQLTITMTRIRKVILGCCCMVVWCI